MDPQMLAKMITVLKDIDERKSSQAFTNDIWFEFVAAKQNNLSNDIISALQQFDEVSNIDIAKNERPALVVSKRRTSTSDDFNVNANFSYRKKDKNNSSDGNSVEASFGGSPMKLQTFANLSALESPLSSLSVSHTNTFIKKLFIGLDLQEARYLLSLYTISCKRILNDVDESDAKRIPSIWVLCNNHVRHPLPSKSQTIVMLGAEPVPKSKDVCHPRLKLTKVTTPSKPVDDIDSITFPFSKSKSDIVCQAKYDLIENQKALDDGCTVLRVLLEWKTANRLLENFPPEAMATVFASVTSGHPQSPAHGLYVELTVLKNVVSAVSSGDIVWLDNGQKESLIESVHHLVQHAHESDVLDDDDDGGPNDVDKPCTTHFNLDSRHDTDFTDDLWTILVKCSSLSDLIESLHYVFTSLKNGDIQPCLRERNQTTMADLVRDSYRSKMVVPALKGILPLALMAEVGAEKLLWDYVTFFVASGLVPRGSLAFYLTPGLESPERTDRLEKLHNVLETVMMFKVFLPLPLHVMSQIVKKMLLYFEENPVPKANPDLKDHLDLKDSTVLKDIQVLDDQIFKFPVPATAVQSILGSTKPGVWQAEFVNAATSESKMCYLSTTRPFKQLHGEEEEEAEGGEGQTQRPKYYMVTKQESIV